MQGKRKYLLILLFLLIGLGVYTFANPAEEERAEGREQTPTNENTTLDDDERNPENIFERSVTNVLPTFERTIEATDLTAPIVAVNQEYIDGGVLVTLTSNVPLITPVGWNSIDDRTFTRMYTASNDYEVNVIGLNNTRSIISFSIDLDAPIVTILGTNPVYVLVGDKYSDEGAAAYDVVDGNVKSLITDSVNYNVAGIYDIEYSAEDSNGNRTTPVKRMVYVLDPEEDFDKDGYTNKEEIDNGTNPLDDSSKPILETPISAITVTGDGPVVNGKTLQMGVDITPTTATNKKVTWSVINGTGSATINSSGLLKATGVGKVTAKALAQDGSGEFGTKEITIHADLTAYNAALAAVTKTDYTTDSWNAYQVVVAANVVTDTDKQADVDAATNNIIAAQADLVIPVTGISISGDGSVAKDDTLQLTAIITPDNATNPDVTWSIETGGTGSATIDADGLLTGTGVGTVTVKVVSQYKETITATKEITVEASALDAAKANAKTELDTYVDAADYAINNATELATAISDGKSAIDSASDIADVTTALANAKVAIDDIKTDAEIAAEELATAKGNAKIDLGTYVDADDYTTNATALNTAIAEGKTAIDNATDIAGVNTALTNAKAAIDAIKTDAQIAAEELATAKDNAKTELDTYVDVADYTTNAAALSTAIADGKTAIDGASDIAGVATALADAKAAIDTIKTDAQIAAEELATEKTNAKTELENYKVAANYTRNAAALSTAIENGKTAIDNATDIAGVTTALANAKAVIDDIKTDEALNDADIAIAKSNIEAASYTATQVEITDAALALSKAQALVNALELKGTTATVVAGTFTEATAGTEGSINGTDGSYTFTVTIAKGTGTEVTTTEQTMTITATPYDSTEQDNTDIATAKTNIESATYTATQAEASDSAKALTKAQALVEALELKGTSVNVIAGTFEKATTGTEASVNGTDGSFTFTVKINKGLGTEVTTVEKTMTITATKYDPTQDNIDIAAAKGAIEGATYTTTQADVADKDAAKTKVETIISGLDTAGTLVEVVPGSFSGAIAGVAGVFDSTDGSYTFTVKINKGGGAEAITTELTLTITAETTTVSKASKVKVNGEKELDSDKPYLVNGEPAASGTLGSAGCTAHFDSSTGVLTLQGYNGAGIRTLFESNPDLIIKLIGDNNVTTTSSQNGIYNGHYGNIYITSDSDATLNVTSTSDNDYVYAIATNDQGGKSIMIGGKAKVTVTAKTTAASKKTSVAHAGKDFIIQDSASFIGKSTATASGSYAVFTKEKIIINTTGNIDIDCSASSGSYAFNGMNGVDIKNVTLMTLKKATTGSFIAGSKNLSRVAVNIKDNIATYRGGTPYELKVLNGQITAVQEGQIGVPYQGLENDEITITANTIANFKFVKWTNGDGTDIDSSLFVSPTGVDSPEAKIKMPAKDLNIKAEYKSTIFAEQPSFHRGEKKIKWSVGEVTFSGSGDSFKLQKKTAGEWEVKTHPFINSTDAKNGFIEVNNNSYNHTHYLPDGNYRLYFKVDGKDHYSAEFVVQWEDTINIPAIEGVTAPVTGETPATTITATDQYTGTVTWSPTATKFAGNTSYTATITLKAKTGFKLDGVTANYFKVAGATASNAADSGVITAVFPKTALAEQAAPTGLSGEAPTSAANNDGKITGTTTDMEYKLSSATDWTKVTATEITGLAAGTYEVRYAAKEGYNAGATAEVEVPAYVDPAAGAKAEVAKITVDALGTITVGDAKTLLEKAQALVGTGYTVSVKTADETNISAEGIAKEAGEGTISFTVVKSDESANTADTETLNITVKAAALGGTVSIDGTLKFGEVLTANVGSLTGNSNTSTLTYTWKRESETIGANQATYITVEADIGKTITVEVTSSVETGTIIGKASSTIEKADGLPAPLVESFKTAGVLADMIMLKNNGTDFTIKVGTNKINLYEYSIGGSDSWVPLTTAEQFTVAGTSILIRAKETDTHKAGEAAKVILTTEGYVFNSNTGTIINYAGTDKVLDIPSSITIDGVDVNVTKIDRDAFRAKELTLVTMPNTLKWIDTYAFENNLLESIVIPDSVEYLGTQAFEKNKLIKVTIPNSVTVIGPQAFRYNGPGHLSEDIPGDVADKKGKTWELVDGSNKWTVKE